MSDFENATRFGAFAIPSSDRDGRDLLLIVVAARFDLPPPQRAATKLTVSAKQQPPPRVEEYYGEPGKSSVKIEGQAVCTRPATDIYVLGQACAPEEKPVRQMDVNISVGHCSVTMRIVGNRVWQSSLLSGAVPSNPESFVKMPLVWERAFGGVAVGSSEERPIFEARNPIGCGLQERASEAIDTPLPNIEDPRHRLSRRADRPPPMGVSPIARNWQPRVGYAGTYDDVWLRRRAPLWPTDFDERFFCGAPEILQARPHLDGGERVQLQGLHPAGKIDFQLPRLRFVSRSRFTNREVRKALILDGLFIDTEAMQLAMYYRAAVEAPLSLVKHRETLLRLVEPWEGSEMVER
jgi:hypothetical protein